MATGDPCDVCGGPIPRTRRGGAPKRCSRPCQEEHRRRYERSRYEADPDGAIGRVVAYRLRHPERYREQVASRPKPQPITRRGWFLKSRYGLTLAEYDRLAEAQHGLCAVCQRPETRRVNGRVVPLAVDHDHATGAVRGLLCGRCNSILGFFEDPQLFHAATDYLRRHKVIQEVS